MTEQHPSFCARPDEPCGGDHLGAVATWQVQHDEVGVSLRLRLIDDVDPADGRNLGRTAVQLGLSDLAFLGAGGGISEVDASLEPEDARILASLLTRCAARADHANAQGGEPAR